MTEDEKILAKDETAMGPHGYAVIECQYDRNSEYPFKVRYLDEKNERVENPDGYSVVKYVYNNRKRVACSGEVRF